MQGVRIIWMYPTIKDDLGMEDFISWRQEAVST